MAVPLLWTYGCKSVQELAHNLFGYTRLAARLNPAALQVADPSKAGFIFKVNQQGLVAHGSIKLQGTGCQCFWEFFLKDFCCPTSFLG